MQVTIQPIMEKIVVAVRALPVKRYTALTSYSCRMRGLG